MVSWNVQDDGAVKVLVSGDYCRSGEGRTDFLVIDMDSGEHSHIAVDAEGNESTKHDCQNHKLVYSSLSHLDVIKTIFQNNDSEIACCELIRFLSNDENDYLLEDYCDESRLFYLCMNYLDCDYVDNKLQIEQEIKGTFHSQPHHNQNNQ